MHSVGAALAHDVDAGAAGAAQVSAVVCAVDLEFLHCVLAQREANAAGVVVGFTAVHGHAVAPAVAPVKGEAALRSLFHAEV